MERNWKLNDDLSRLDDVLDPINFDEIIMTVRCNCREINREATIKTFKEILEMRLTDAKEIFERNIDEICNEVIAENNKFFAGFY